MIHVWHSQRFNNCKYLLLEKFLMNKELFYKFQPFPPGVLIVKIMQPENFCFKI